MYNTNSSSYARKLAKGEGWDTAKETNKDGVNSVKDVCPTCRRK